MAVGSEIEWTEATWNPSTGCTKISPGCANCYADRLTKRLQLMNLKKYQYGFKFVEHSNDLNLPLTWKKPKKVFVNSMSDLFHEQASFEFIRKCFFTMIKAHWHTYQVLTKRPEKMKKFSYIFTKEFEQNIPSKIWMGVSVENSNYAWRIDKLRTVACETRFVSFEPLLGDVSDVDLTNIDWAIIGGESGTGYRKVKEDWIWNIIKQCKKQKVAVFFKQWGGFRPKSGGRKIKGKSFDEYPKIQSNKKIRAKEHALLEKILACEQIELSKSQEITSTPELLQIAKTRTKKPII